MEWHTRHIAISCVARIARKENFSPPSLALACEKRQGRRYFPNLGIYADPGKIDTVTDMAALLEMYGVSSLAGTLRIMDAQYMEQQAADSLHAEGGKRGCQFNASHLGQHKRTRAVQMSAAQTTSGSDPLVMAVARAMQS